MTGTAIFFRIIAYTAQFSVGGGWGEFIEHKMWVLISPTKFISNISHSKKNPARHYHKRAYVFT